jgi:hypothetical protein
VVQHLTAPHLHRVPSHYHHGGFYHHHQIDWVILISAYFASFVLADVTTTNVLGADHHRVAKGLSEGAPFWRVLLLKNLTLLVIVGLPTLLVAMVLTLWMQTPARLGDTIPNVAVPIVSGLGVGNVISVLLPVGSEPLIQRWHARRNWRRTGTWILALTLPYALYYVADPMGGVEHKVLWTGVPAAIGPVFGRDTKSFVHLGIAVTVWAGRHSRGLPVGAQARTAVQVTLLALVSDTLRRRCHRRRGQEGPGSPAVPGKSAPHPPDRRPCSSGSRHRSLSSAPGMVRLSTGRLGPPVTRQSRLQLLPRSKSHGTYCKPSLAKLRCLLTNGELTP